MSPLCKPQPSIRSTTQTSILCGWWVGVFKAKRLSSLAGLGGNATEFRLSEPKVTLKM